MLSTHRGSPRIAAGLALVFALTTACPPGWADEPQMPLGGPRDPDPAVSLEQAQDMAEAEADLLTHMAQQAAAGASSASAKAPTGTVAVSGDSATPNGVRLTFTVPGTVEAQGSWGDGVWGHAITLSGTQAFDVGIPPWTPGPHRFFVKYRDPGESNPWSEPIASDGFHYAPAGTTPATPPPIAQPVEPPTVVDPTPPPPGPDPVPTSSEQAAAEAQAPSAGEPKAFTTMTTGLNAAGDPTDTTVGKDAQGHVLFTETLAWDSLRTHVLARTETSIGVDATGRPQATTTTFDARDRLITQEVKPLAPPITPPPPTTPIVPPPPPPAQPPAPARVAPGASTTFAQTVTAGGHRIDTTTGTDPQGGPVFTEAIEYDAPVGGRQVTRTVTTYATDAEGHRQETTRTFDAQDRLITPAAKPPAPPPPTAVPPEIPKPPALPPTVAPPKAELPAPPPVTPPPPEPALAVTKMTTVQTGGFPFAHLTVTANRPFVTLTVQYRQADRAFTGRAPAWLFASPVSAATVTLEPLALGATYEYLVRVVDGQGRIADSETQTFFLPSLPPSTPPVRKQARAAAPPAERPYEEPAVKQLPPMLPEPEPPTAPLTESVPEPQPVAPVIPPVPELAPSALPEPIVEPSPAENPGIIPVAESPAVELTVVNGGPASVAQTPELPTMDPQPPVVETAPSVEPSIETGAPPAVVPQPEIQPLLSEPESVPTLSSPVAVEPSALEPPAAVSEEPVPAAAQPLIEVPPLPATSSQTDAVTDEPVATASPLPELPPVASNSVRKFVIPAPPTPPTPELEQPTDVPEPIPSSAEPVSTPTEPPVVPSEGLVLTPDATAREPEPVTSAPSAVTVTEMVKPIVETVGPAFVPSGAEPADAALESTPQPIQEPAPIIEPSPAENTGMTPAAGTPVAEPSVAATAPSVESSVEGDAPPAVAEPPVVSEPPTAVSEPAPAAAPPSIEEPPLPATSSQTDAVTDEPVATAPPPPELPPVASNPVWKSVIPAPPTPPTPEPEQLTAVPEPQLVAPVIPPAPEPIPSALPEPIIEPSPAESTGVIPVAGTPESFPSSASTVLAEQPVVETAPSSEPVPTLGGPAVAEPPMLEPPATMSAEPVPAAAPPSIEEPLLPVTPSPTDALTTPPSEAPSSEPPQPSSTPVRKSTRPTPTASEPKVFTTLTTSTNAAGHPVDTTVGKNAQGHVVFKEELEWDATRTHVLQRAVTTYGVDTQGRPQETTHVFDAQDRRIREEVSPSTITAAGTLYRTMIVKGRTITTFDPMTGRPTEQIHIAVTDAGQQIRTTLDPTTGHPVLQVASTFDVKGQLVYRTTQEITYWPNGRIHELTMTIEDLAIDEKKRVAFFYERYSATERLLVRIERGRDSGLQFINEYDANDRIIQGTMVTTGAQDRIVAHTIIIYDLATSVITGYRTKRYDPVTSQLLGEAIETFTAQSRHVITYDGQGRLVSDVAHEFPTAAAPFFEEIPIRGEERYYDPATGQLANRREITSQTDAAGRLEVVTTDFDAQGFRIQRIATLYSEVGRGRQLLGQTVTHYYSGTNRRAETVEISYEPLEPKPIGAGQRRVVTRHTVTRYENHEKEVLAGIVNTAIEQIYEDGRLIRKEVVVGTHAYDFFNHWWAALRDDFRKTTTMYDKGTGFPIREDETLQVYYDNVTFHYLLKSIETIKTYDALGRERRREVTETVSPTFLTEVPVASRTAIAVARDAGGHVTAVEAKPVEVSADSQTATGVGFAAIYLDDLHALHADGYASVVKGAVSFSSAPVTGQWQVRQAEVTATVRSKEPDPSHTFAQVNATQQVSYTPEGKFDKATVTGYTVTGYGARVIRKPDGAIEFYFPADPGPYVTRKADGTIQLADGGGVTRQTLPDGTIVLQHPSGLSWRIRPDGAIAVVRAANDATWTRPSAEIALLWQHDTFTVTTPDGVRAEFRPELFFGATAFLIEELERLQARR